MSRKSALGLGMLLVAVLLLFTSCDNGGGDGGDGGDIRFRLAFAVSVDGAVKTSSSIINVLFYGGGGTGSGSPYRFYTSTEGVAPVVDLWQPWLAGCGDGTRW